MCSTRGDTQSMHSQFFATHSFPFKDFIRNLHISMPITTPSHFNAHFHQTLGPLPTRILKASEPHDHSFQFTTRWQSQLPLRRHLRRPGRYRPHQYMQQSLLGRGRAKKTLICKKISDSPLWIYFAFSCCAACFVGPGLRGVVPFLAFPSAFSSDFVNCAHVCGRILLASIIQ